MVKKRLSKEYMELLRRNQNSVMTVSQAQPCLVLPPPRHEDPDQEHQDDGDQEHQDDSDYVPYETITEEEEEKVEQEVTEVGQDIGDGDVDCKNKPKPQFEQDKDTEDVVNGECIEIENAPEIEIIRDDVGEVNDCDKRSMIKAYLRRSLQTERQAARIPTPSRRRREVSYPVNSSSAFQRLMTIVKVERDKHQEMINMVRNTSFAMSRRPLVIKSKVREKGKRNKEKSQGPEDEGVSTDKCFKSSPSGQSRVDKLDVKPSRSVHFKTLVTFDDNSTPVPIRPPRKKTLRFPTWAKRSRFQGCKTTPAVSLRRKTFLRKESEEDMGEAPEKPSRIYKGRRATPVTEALRPIASHQYESSLGESLSDSYKAINFSHF